MEVSKKAFTLTLRPVNTGVKSMTDAYETLKNMVVGEKKYFYAFWGCYGDEVTDTADKDVIRTESGKYYLRETEFTVVTGYEKVRFEDALDRSVYHIPKSVYGEGGMQPGSTLTVKTFDADNKETSSVSNTKSIITKGRSDGTDELTYMIRVGKVVENESEPDNYWCSFALIEAPGGETRQWTLADRLGFMREETTKDGDVEKKVIVPDDKYKFIIVGV